MYFQKPFSFEGRISRGEYFVSLIIVYAIYIVVPLILNIVYKVMFADSDEFRFILYIPYLGLFFIVEWFYIAQGTKRCHDRGNSGWYQLIPFYFLVMLFGIGQFGENGWGTDPLLETGQSTSEENY